MGRAGYSELPCEPRGEGGEQVTLVGWEGQSRQRQLLGQLRPQERGMLGCSRTLKEADHQKKVNESKGGKGVGQSVLQFAGLYKDVGFLLRCTERIWCSLICLLFNRVLLT